MQVRACREIRQRGKRSGHHALRRRGAVLARETHGHGGFARRWMHLDRHIRIAARIEREVFELHGDRTFGDDRAINVGTEADALAAYNQKSFDTSKGYFDVLFEASGNARALAGAMEVVRPRGILVQVGLGGDMQLPMNMIVAKEFEMRGAFRFHEEYAHAVEMLNKRRVDVKPLITATIHYKDAGIAFALAADRAQAMKVMFSFE